jgi:hypothetical protein
MQLTPVLFLSHSCLARSLRGLCENKNFSSPTPAGGKILARNGLSSLTRNITARPCENLFPPNLTGPKGGATTRGNKFDVFQEASNIWVEICQILINY